jgi:prophage regulatory protein
MENYRLIRPQQVQELLSISQATLYRMMKEPGFPPKIKLSSQAIAFKEADIQNWIDSRLANTTQS